MSRRDPFLWVIPLILSALGVIVILSLTSVRLGDGSLSFTMGKKQAQWLAVALGAMLIVSAVPLRFWWDQSGFFLIFTWGLSWLPLIPGAGSGGGGALRWIRIGDMTVQPLEFLTLFLVVHLCKIYGRGALQGLRAFGLTLFLGAMTMLPILLQPDLGGAVLLFLLSMGLYVGAYGILLPLTSVILLSPVFAFLSKRGYRMRRITAWSDPWSDPGDVGYQTIQGLVAFANGGFWGTGLGRAMQRSRFLPAAHTDFIFAALGETLGVWGSIGVLALFSLWFFRVYTHFRRCQNPRTALLFWGMGLSMALPLLINVGGVTNLIPMTGMPLPFLSYGGSSLVLSWIKVGMILRAVREMEVME